MMDQYHVREMPNEEIMPHMPFLDAILENYDKRAWPTHGTPKSTIVDVHIDIHSMGPLDTSEMSYALDLHLHQAWYDPRLNLQKFGINETLTLRGDLIMPDIWKPDLFFANAKKASVPQVTVPNQLVKIAPDGRVSYSMRITLSLACLMNFRRFPLDKQACPMVLRPYAQRIDQTKLSWGRYEGLALEFPIEMEEYEYVDYVKGEYLDFRSTGTFSCLNATFLFDRRIHYHLLQTYFPTCLAVFISWVGFWIRLELPQIRVALGAMTLFTVTSVASGIRSTVPPVAYAKVVDVWITGCIIIIFAEISETVLANYLIRVRLRPYIMRKMDFGVANLFHHWRYGYPTDDFLLKMDPTEKLELHRNYKRAEALDRTSRYIFPLSFAFFNLIYWILYSHEDYVIEFP
ncbi:glycine receptor subunit alpha-2-like [Ornithodoros turicata]|uniref:glycine receptor subunit alpha-2-like n=1 Tax=Ornithodoros turicata TaxID=34597 RepID=UPI003139980C